MSRYKPGSERDNDIYEPVKTYYEANRIALSVIGTQKETYIVLQDENVTGSSPRVTLQLYVPRQIDIDSKRQSRLHDVMRPVRGAPPPARGPSTGICHARHRSGSLVRSSGT